MVLKTWKNNENWTKLNVNYSRFSITLPNTGVYHVKADVLRISKMWYFLGVALFKGELLPVEVGSNSKKIARVC